MRIFHNFLMVLILIISPPLLAKNQNHISDMLPGVVKITANMRPTNFIHEYTSRARGIQWKTGSGFIVSREGFIVTNYHVIQDAHEIWVTFYDQKMVRVRVVGFDYEFDLAVLQPVEAVAMPKVLEWGSSSQIRAGDTIFVIGNPLGLEFSISEGIVSHPAREYINPLYAAIQTDASINQGNSGGPVLNVKGQVIGVAVSIASQTGGNVGLGFAIPADIAKTVVDVLSQGKPFQRRIIGLEVEQNWQISNNVLVPWGVRIKSVIAGSFAARAGIQQNDIILELNGETVRSVAGLIINLISSTGELKITVIRGGQKQMIVVHI